MKMGIKGELNIFSVLAIWHEFLRYLKIDLSMYVVADDVDIINIQGHRNTEFQTLGI